LLPGVSAQTTLLELIEAVLQLLGVGALMLESVEAVYQLFLFRKINWLEIKLDWGRSFPVRSGQNSVRTD
jgi:hypothetical protein